MTGSINEPNVEQNAGACDICGKLIDMTSGDKLVMQEFGIRDEDVKEEHDLTDEDAIEVVAEALEREAGSAEGLELVERDSE